MKRKILTTILMLHFLGCMTAIVWAPTSKAIDWWDPKYTRQSDLMYDYRWSYIDYTKYLNPWSSSNQRYTTTASDFAYKYTMRQSDLMYRYNSFYSDPTKYWNPMSTINQRDNPRMSDLTYKYRSSSADPAKYWNPMSTINQRYYSNMRDFTYKYTMPTKNIRYTMPPDLTLKYMDMLPPSSSQRYSLPPTIESHWYPSMISATSRTLDLPPVTMNLKYSNMGAGSNQWRSYQDYSSRVTDLRDVWTDLKFQSDISRIGSVWLSFMRFVTGPGAVSGGGLIASGSKLLSPPTSPVHENARIGGNILNVVGYVQAALNERYLRAGSIIVGYGLDMWGRGIFDMLRFPITTSHVNLYNWSRVEHFGSGTTAEWGEGRHVIIQTYHNDPMWLPNQSKLGVPDYLDGTYDKRVITNEVSHYYSGPSSLTLDISLSRAYSTPIKPLDLNTLSPQTQRLVREHLFGTGTALTQLSNYFSSLRTPSLDNWLNQMSRVPSISALQPSSSFYSWRNSLFGFRNSWSYTSLLTRNWYNYNYNSGRWRY